MQSGDVLGGMYEVLEPIGTGGLGAIYLGWHINLRKYVVIKKIKDQWVNLVNCRIEADILKGLHHQGLPQVYDFLELPEGIFSVIDYIPGNDLAAYIDGGTFFEEELLFDWLMQLCNVLDYLHTREIPVIHCDIKPGNIMLTPGGDVCLIDFNISLNGENNKDMIGVSSRYASPEQMELSLAKLEHRPCDIVIDGRSDIYSLGGVFYTLMSGMLPKERREHDICLKDMELPYSSALVNIVDQCMETDIRKRFQSAAKLKEALLNRERWTKEHKKKMLVLKVCAAVLPVVCIAGLCFGAVTYNHRKSERFFAEYEQYVEMAEAVEDPFADSEELDSVLSSGRTFLNTDSYESLFKKYPEQKADVLYCMALASMAKDEPVTAADYLTEAVSLKADDADMFRDLSVAYAMCGRVSQAQTALSQAVQQGLPETDAAMAEAELALLSGDYEKAYERAAAAAQSTDMTVVSHSAAVMESAVAELRNYAQYLEFVQGRCQAYRGAARWLWLQKCGNLCVLLLNGEAADESAMNRQELIKLGISCYEELRANACAKLWDCMNLVYLYEDGGRLKDAKKLLLELSGEYTGEYMIPAQQAYICYRLENDKPLDQRDYSVVQDYYERALQLCREAGEDASVSDSIRQLDGIISELEEKGWLK